MSKYKEMDFSDVKTYPVAERPSKVSVQDFLKIPKTFSTSEFIDSLPDILAGKNLKELIYNTKNALNNNKPLIIMHGGHVIKCGLSPLLIKAIESGIIDTIAVNGSVCIHDFEIAFFGKTSEIVDKAIEDGTFGMGEETGRDLNEAIKSGYRDKLGYGEAVGKFIYEQKPKYIQYSLLAKAYEYEIPVTVHAALGTDIIHQHKQADGESLGGASYRDFKIFTNRIKNLNDGGVLVNFGSAVILPEVFLKAITVVRNLGYPLKNFYTAVFDMIMHYRPRTNIVNRPTSMGGRGYYIIGQHEIMLPLFFYSLLEE
ncbi:MAG: hypothetical protein KGY75_06270 [Candidatus Cloacimonetes bacterium]|nr:hypothetical protein [Candidatus Cloacimonadota bacterium]MBS3767705.1 hypothetical protein [Candidatus Cloacimonadota bacterium]